MSKIIDSEKSILNPSFKYTPSSKTDISRTFARIKREIRGGQDKLKPLVPEGNSLNEPLVPSLNQGQFVLPVEWFELLE